MTEQFKQFKIGELFAVTSGKWLSKVDQKPGKTPFISSSAKNNGIMTYINKKPLFPANTITVASHGSVGATFFQTVPYYASSNVNSLSYKNGNLSEKVGLYFVAAIQHVSKNYGFSHILSVTRTKQMEIMLPVTPMGEPDFAYMTMQIRELEAERIRELEAERIRELEAYLRVTGLDDTTLSASEAQDLKQDVKWKKFRIGDMFERVSLPRKIKHFKKSRDVSTVQSLDYNLPLVNSKVGNNGVMYYGKSSEWNSTNLAIDIIQDGAVGAGMVYAHPDSVGCLYNAYLIRWKDDSDNITPEVVLYFATMIRKAVRGNYNYQRKATWDRVQENDFLLPVTSDDQIDFNYMQDYIRAIEKQTIKGVVEYKDQVIDETKKVVNG